MTIRSKWSLGLPVLAGVAVIAAQAGASEHGNVFQGKQIRFVTMGGPGGGYDTYMRALIPPLEKALGARLIPVNEPAAGGLVAMSRVVSAAPDGTTLGLIGGEALTTAELYRVPGAHFKLAEVPILGRVSAEAKVIVVSAKSRYNSIGDIISSGATFNWAGSGNSDGNSDFAALLAHATGMKSKIIIGYKGSGGMNLAIENGEVDARVVSDEAAALFTRGKQMRVLAVMARERSTSFPEITTIFEQAKFAPTDEKILDWRAGVADLGRLVVTTPNTPSDRIKILRAALERASKDESYLKEVRARGLEPRFFGGREDGE
jgi:tripartite-type tricarboxylate transporter receptor subunit TctC